MTGWFESIWWWLELDGTECLCPLVFELLVECIAVSDGWDVITWEVSGLWSVGAGPRRIGCGYYVPYHQAYPPESPRPEVMS
jgi:hypothetical protein